MVSFIPKLINIDSIPADVIYKLDINTDKDNHYVLYFPTVYKQNETIMEFSEDNIIGNGKISHKNENGTWLEIIGIGPVSIHYSASSNEHLHWTGKYMGENVTNDRDHQTEYQIFYISEGNSSVTIKFIWKYLGVGREDHVDIDGIVQSNGWQVITGDERHIMIA